MNTITSTVPATFDHPSAAPDRAVTNVKVRGFRLPWGRIIAGAAVLAVAASGIASYLRYSAGFVTTDDSFLEGDVHPVSPRIDGTIIRVLIDDNAHVESGQPLAEIDPADLNLAVQASEGDLAQARANEMAVTAQIARAEADVETAAARVRQNAAQLALAELDFHRTETLTHSGAASEEALDQARAAFDAAQAAQQSLVSARASAEAGLAASRAQHSVALAQIEKAEAALGFAKLQSDYTVIRAPSAGRIAKKTVEVGQRVQPGQPLMAVVSDRVWVVANFKESQLARLQPGERAEVKVDAVDGRVFDGVVESFSPGTGAEFSLLPADNATGNFTKVVQRVPVKIMLSDKSLEGLAARLSPGLSAIVRVSVRR